jgi:CSLREA domain-containing protein
MKRFTRHATFALALGLGLTLALLWAVNIEPVQTARAAIVSDVNTTDDELNSDGDCSLREAIQAANTDTQVDQCPAGNGNDTIVLPVGTYTLTLAGAGEDANTTGDLDIFDTDALTITGAGAGQTIINAGGIDRVFNIHPGAGTVVISGVTVFGGQTSNVGGGICSDDADLTLINVSIISNTASSGGGVYVDGSVTLIGGQIISNTADSGGGVYVNASSAAFTQTGASTIAHNVAFGTTIIDGGGGVYVYWGNATLEGGQILSNTADSGGGVYVGYGSATMEGGQIVGNKANGAGGGAIVRSSFASLNVSKGQIVSNTALIGGGLYNRGGTLILVNTTVSRNTASMFRGGGLFSEYSSATSVLTYTTVASNTAASGAGGIEISGGGTVLLQNSIVAYNGPSNCRGGPTSNGHNLEYGNTCHLTATGDITDTNPLLGPLIYDSSTWVHPLQEDSPAIDAGICVVGVTTDQRGVTRPQGSACDIGAYEWSRRLVYLPLILSEAEGLVLRND